MVRADRLIRFIVAASIAYLNYNGTITGITGNIYYWLLLYF